MRVTRIAGLLYAVGLVGTGLATPLRRPLSVPKNVPRADTSSDPSCPDGFFCQQQSCSDDVKCPSGEECLNFEGHFACAPQGLKWCALNPTSLEAVGCGSGSCCHGQCYSSAAVCCDFPSIKCTIGKACNICSPDEKCGDNQCVDFNPTTATTTTKTAVPPPASTTTTTTTTKATTSSTMSSTTSKPGTTTTTTTSKTTTAPTSTTTKSTTSTTTTSTKSSTSSTSTTTTTSPTAPTPTIVDSIGSFSFNGCYEDTPDTRVLIADSSEQQGSDGMTVEKCIALAQEGAWRYAGVEYSYQCFVGNTIHNGNLENTGDCNTACAGNPDETCGGGNRIQIYEDSTWTDPTLDELADAVREYNATVVEAREVIDSYNEHLKTLQDIMASSSSKTKRAGGPYVNIEMQIKGDRSAANSVSSKLALVESSSERTLTEGRRLDTFDADHPSVPADALEEFITTARMIIQQINFMILDAERTLAALAQAAIDNLPPAIDIVASLKTIAEGIAAVGEPVGPATGATGAFLVLAYLLSLFVGGGSGDDHTTTLAPTTTTTTIASTTTTTTTTTSSCTATATPTTIIVFTKQGTSVSDYNELVAGFPKDPESIQLTNSWQPNFMYVGEMDQCTAEALDDNPLVDSWAIDADIDVEDFDTDEAATTTKRSMYNETITDEHSDFNKRGNPTAQSAFFQQANSPSHLQWLSQVSRYTALAGNYYSFDDLVYNDPDFTIGQPPIVYIVDTGFENDHPDIAGRVMAQLAVDDLGQNIIPQTAPGTSHGTCMATLAAGSYSGMGKNARIVTAQLTVSLPGQTQNVRCSRTFFLLMHVWLHAVNNNAQGNAVVSMSFAVPKDRLKWNPDNPNSRNVFDTVLDWYWLAGISTVASAGNDETSAHNDNYKDLSSSVPRGVGGRDSNLIVVGNSNWDTSRYRSSNYRDTIRQAGILSLYNVGTNVECGVMGEAWSVEPPGTSQATAITAGMIAYFLAQPELKADWTRNGVQDVPGLAKQYLIDTARKYKGDFAAVDGIPRAALGETVPCTAGTAGRPAQQDARTGVTDHTLSTGQVTDGSQVVINPLPQCWNLN